MILTLNVQCTVEKTNPGAKTQIEKTVSDGTYRLLGRLTYKIIVDCCSC